MISHLGGRHQYWYRKESQVLALVATVKKERAQILILKKNPQDLLAAELEAVERHLLVM